CDTHRLVLRYSAAFVQKFSSSIAPHITTLLVHGKQVKCPEV
ncbi:PREDICTED: phosphorylase b kinase regulatory subunit beta-like, partial [Tinamus guttatus]